MYNGAPASLVSTAVGAKRGSIDVASHGIVTRGVLLDVPAVRGRLINDGEGVTGADLTAAEQHARTTVGPGDAVFVRTGYSTRRPTGSDVRPGLSTDCLPYLWDRQCALLATDCPTDLHPSGYPTLNAPVHVVFIVAMGGWIIDNCDLETLAAVCARERRYEFLITICPLRLKNSTGSPVNPIAIF
jgi:kynurenine formamidase